jgi:hypothetical protein
MCNEEFGMKNGKQKRVSNKTNASVGLTVGRHRNDKIKNSNFELVSFPGGLPRGYRLE